MPLTPETWLTEFTVNLTTTGVQTRSRITQLANGNILVSWDSNANTGAGAATGVDVIGQLYDPLGVPIGSEFRLNSSFSADDERNADIAALPGGGFIVVYEDFNVANNNRSIRLAEYNAAGITVTDTEIVIDDITNNADPAHFNPRVAVSSATSVLVVWQEEEVGGDSRIAARVYNPVTDTYSGVISVINFPGTNTSPSVGVLSNGNYVAVCATTDSLNANDQVISYRIMDSVGGNVTVATRVAATVGDGQFDRDASVAALTGGGFVIAWTNTDANDTDIQAQIFDAAGVVQPGVLSPGDTGSTNNARSSFVVALLDGGFIIGFDEDANNTIVVQRYSATGVEVGDAFVIASGAGSANPSGVLMDDGRVAITFQGSNNEIGMEIIDIRDAANAPVYAPDDYQIGTIGDDSFSVSAVFGYGHDGNDAIFDGGRNNTIFGGLGNDTITISGVSNFEEVYGGSGDDTLISIGIGPDAIYNLLNGTVTDPLALEIQIAEGFEHVIGSVFSETFIGSGAGNSITGDGGDDTLFGGAGIDTLFGNTGNDTLFGDTGNDTLFGNTGDDTLAGGGDIDTLFGGDGDDVLDGGLFEDNSFGGAGNDRFRISGGDYGDNVSGGADSDTLDLSGWTHGSYSWNVNLQTGVVELVPNDFGAGGIYSIDTVEHVTGSDFNDSLTGDGLGNSLNGGAGNDTLTGGDGNDSFVVSAQGDVIVEAGGGGTDLVLAAATYALAAGVQVETLQTTSFAGVGAINLTGNALAQTIIGNAGANTLEDGAGAADTLTGAAGNDTYVVRTAGTAIVEGVGEGTADRVSAAVSFALAADDNIEIMQTTSFAGVGSINLTGNALAQTITGNAGANALRGAAGNDTLTGGAGADSFVFDTALTPANIDAITDFAVGVDEILLRDTIFAGIGVGGLAANEFHAGLSGQALNADTRIIYETDNGNLWYDADGTGAGLRVQFGDLVAGLAVTASDFTVF